MSEINPETGEVQESALITYSSLAPEIYTNISQRPVEPEQAEILLDNTNPDELDILPTGEIYLPQNRYRQRLNQAFGPGGWAMRPLSQAHIQENLAIQEWALYASGQFMAYAVGKAKLIESNERMDWGDVLESIKSNALMRLCKDLGIAMECWDKRFTAKFKADYCIQIWRESQTKPQWRRVDAEPWYDETGTVQNKISKPSPPKQQPPQSDKSNGHKPKKERPMPLEDIQDIIAMPKFANAKPANDKQRKYAVSSLGKVGFSEDHHRHAFGEWAFGQPSSKEWTSGQCSFVIDWVGAKKENGFTPDPGAIAEAEAIRGYLAFETEMNQEPDRKKVRYNFNAPS